MKLKLLLMASLVGSVSMGYRPGPRNQNPVPQAPTTVKIINRLPAGNDLITDTGNIKIVPGASHNVHFGSKIRLVLPNGTQSNADYISLESKVSGGDKKYGRLMSVCSMPQGYLDECSIYFAEQLNK